MISARKRPTNMETRKASSVALVLLCIAPLRMSKYPNWSIWRKVTNYDYFRLEVTLRKTTRPSGARSMTPRYIWSSILPQSTVLPRTVDPAKMQTVEAMIKAPDHREKMPHIIKTILEFAFLTYSGRSDQWLTSFYRMISLIADLPKGPIKGNSMRKLAAKVTSSKY